MKSQEELRREIRGLLEAQGPVQRESRSRSIAQKVLSWEAFQKAETIHFYYSTPKEVDTTYLIDESLDLGKRVVLPRADAKNKTLSWYWVDDPAVDLEKSSLGLWEPKRRPDRLWAEKAQCVLVPGVVFDKNNNRIGRGAGFYDRFLASLAPGAVKAGLAFSFQVVERIPAKQQDVPMDRVICDGD